MCEITSRICSPIDADSLSAVHAINALDITAQCRFTGGQPLATALAPGALGQRRAADDPLLDLDTATAGLDLSESRSAAGSIRAGTIRTGATWPRRGSGVAHPNSVTEEEESNETRRAEQTGRGPIGLALVDTSSAALRTASTPKFGGPRPARPFGKRDATNQNGRRRVARRRSSRG